MMNALIMLLLIVQIKPEVILQNLRKNLRYSSSSFSAELEIRRGKRMLKKTFNGYSIGENFFMEFTNPDDKGVRYLKLKNDLYIYLPDIDDVVRLSGDMLKQSFMGSDLSYEDLMQEDPLKYYKANELKDTLVDNKKLHILELVDTTGTAPYHRVRLLVDVEKNIWLKEELYSKTGRKMKEVEALEYKETNGRLYPVSIIMRDLRLRDSYTKFTFSKIALDIQIPERHFKLENLKK